MTNQNMTNDKEIAAVYRARAQTFMKRGKLATSDAKTYNLLTFYLGGERYGIELGQVAVVLPLAHYTFVPGGPPEITGITNIRGEVCALIDLKVLFKLPATNTPNFILLLKQKIDSRVSEIGVLVDHLDQVESTSGEMTELASPYLKGLLANTLPVVNVDAILTKNTKKK